MNKSKLLAYLELQSKWIEHIYETLNNNEYNNEMKLGLMHNHIYFIRLGNEKLTEEVEKDE